MRQTNSYAMTGETAISVGELNRAVRDTLEGSFPLLWVSGEISNFTRAASGHLYFTLKDEQAQVRCAMFRNRAALLPWQLASGQRIEARALVTLYEARGDYQLTVETVRRAGVGSLHEAFVRLKDKLLAEGLFDPERKRALPHYPRRIGIVTSPQAAALSDIVTAFKRRAPHIHLTLFPSQVQGDAAPAQLCQALEDAIQSGDQDLIILARGGGSLEDLWAFNDETLARAVAACPVPIISGVGHETDFTITDLAADLRAATPTAAAELASAAWVEAGQTLTLLQAKLERAMSRLLERRGQKLDQLARGLISPAARLTALRKQLTYATARLSSATEHRVIREQTRLGGLSWRLSAAKPNAANHRRHVDALASRLDHALATQLGTRRATLEQLQTALHSLNPEDVLRRGYAIVRDEGNRIVTGPGQLLPHAPITLQFATGEVRARVEGPHSG